MKRPRQHVLEDESRLAVKNLLPSEWIVEDIHRDYGLDMQITIVEGEIITNTIFCVQIKATDKTPNTYNPISLSMNTKNLVYYEKHPLPVFILYYIKTMNAFYYVFAQRYIKENLSANSPGWRKKETNTVSFSPGCILQERDQIKSIIVDSALYVTLSILNLGDKSAIYWIDGIPKSDDEELKSLTLMALDFSKQHKFQPAIDTFERILKICTVSPTEKMAILVSMGNAYCSLSSFDEALNNYLAAEQILTKIKSSEVLEGKACIYSGIGLVYSSKSQYDEALSYHRKALKLFRKIGYIDGEAGTLNNIGNIYRQKGEFTKALYNMRLALRIHQSSKSLKGQAIVLGNIGNIFNEKANLVKALEYYRLALKVHRKVGNLVGVANMLGSIGSTYGKNGEQAKAVYNLGKALKIFRSIGEQEGQATTFNNLANVYYDKRNTIIAMKYARASLDITVMIGDRHGQALSLSTIGNVFGASGELEEALLYYRSAESILIEIGEKTNLSILQQQLSRLNQMIISSVRRR